jgi:hypothetical protein
MISAEESVKTLNSVDVVFYKHANVRKAYQDFLDEAEKKPDSVNPSVAALELGISTKNDDLSSSVKQFNTKPIRIGIYILPFAVMGLLALVRKTRKKRQVHAPQRNAAQALADVMKKAPGMEAKEASSALSNALNALLSSTDTPHGPFQEICEKIDAEAIFAIFADHRLWESFVDRFLQSAHRGFDRFGFAFQADEKKGAAISGRSADFVDDRVMEFGFGEGVALLDAEGDLPVLGFVGHDDMEIGIAGQDGGKVVLKRVHRFVGGG